jgi:hypothetical protein
MNRSSDGFHFGNNSTQFNQRLNVSSNHPIIQNTNDYFVYKKYVSIHSEDRDMLRFPDSSQFEIELPEDMTNVYKLTLTDWTFPANYNTFSILNENVAMTFKINIPYNPNENAVQNDLSSAIFEALFLFNKDYFFIIEDGFYNPSQMSTTLTNKFNEAVSNQILVYFKTQITNPLPPPAQPTTFWQQMLDEFISSGQYRRFVIVYNDVGQKFWFGNTADSFILTSEAIAVYNALTPNILCGVRAAYKEFASWGLPCNLGLSRCNITATKGSQTIDSIEVNYTPRFYYGDVFSGDNGYWLLPSPTLTGSYVYYAEANYKINLMGYSHFYMEIEGQNCLDETSPYNPSAFTFTRPNTTNGVVNSAFAKISVPTTPITQWFDRNSLPFKFYDPPADKIRKLNIKLRYHNNQLVNFGAFNYSFTLEFTQMVSQFNRKLQVVNFTQLG